MKARGFQLVALTPLDGATDLRDHGGGERVAAMFGAEGPGLSPAALAAADVLARIPMAHGVDSLNLGSAAAIAMWQLFGDGSRQRTGGT